MFNLEEFDIKLETNTLGRNFIYTEEIASSNSYLMENSQALRHGTVIMTEFQQDGKGRLNRPWYSNKGQNLTFSVLIKNDLQKFKPNHLSLAASLSVSVSIENLYQLKTDLKWPNDVLINNKKICGILLESSVQGEEIEKVVLGIGVNVNQTKFTGGFKIQPTSVRFEMKREINRERLLSEILNTFESYFYQLNNNSKILLDEWRDRCRMIGEHIFVEMNDEKKFGVFEDIDEDGFMILKSGDKTEKILSGDISVRK